MKGNLIYYAIIVVGVGAIAYMYNLSTVAGDKNFDKELDQAIAETGVNIK